jgi:hypothetical protein
MPAPILATKLYIPPPRFKIVLRPRLIERLNAGCAQDFRLTLISASAGFGKTTLVSEWIAVCGMPVAWLSLDEGDNDPARFITYLVKALQNIEAGIGDGLLAALQSPEPLQIEVILTNLVNEISILPGDLLLILDDYHVIDSPPLGNHLLFTIFTVAMAFFMTFAGPQTPATIADITLPGVRSTALSIQYLVENSGAALAPFLAGLIAVEASLGQAIFIVSFAWLIAALFIAFVAFFVPRDHARMHQQLSLRAAAQTPARGETK